MKGAYYLIQGWEKWSRSLWYSSANSRVSADGQKKSTNVRFPRPRVRCAGSPLCITRTFTSRHSTCQTHGADAGLQAMWGPATSWSVLILRGHVWKQPPQAAALVFTLDECESVVIKLSAGLRPCFTNPGLFRFLESCGRSREVRNQRGNGERGPARTTCRTKLKREEGKVAVGAVLLCLETTGACLEQSKDVTAPGYPPHSGSPIERRLYWCEKRKQTRQRPKDATRDPSKQGLVS